MQMRNAAESSTRGLIFGTLTVLVLAVPAFAQKPAAIDPKALELLKQSTATYAALHSYSCRAVAVLKVDALPGSRIINMTLAFQKPDHATVAVTKYEETQQFLTDGRSLYLYAPDRKEYLQEALPPGIPAAAAVLTQGESFIGLTLMKPDGILSDNGNIKSLTLRPPETLNGVPVQTVTKVMRAKNGGTMTFFITIGVEDHLLYRFADTILSPTPLPTGDTAIKARRIDNTETYTDIKADPVLPATDFLPPAGAKKISETK